MGCGSINTSPSHSLSQFLLIEYDGDESRDRALIDYVTQPISILIYQHSIYRQRFLALYPFLISKSHGGGGEDKIHLEWQDLIAKRSISNISVIVACLDKDVDKRRFMLNAYDKGMTTDEYVYILPDYVPRESK